MKVICEFDNLNSIKDKNVYKRLKNYIFSLDGQLDLLKGKKYTVYGIVFWDNSPWYYICTDENDDYPTPIAAEFFKVQDPALSRYWQVSSYPQEEVEVYTALVFEEWAKDPLFYEHLIEGSSNAMVLFKQYQSLMDNEQK